MRLQPGNRLQLIFHRGVKVKDTRDFKFAESLKLIEWLAKDRGVITIVDQAELAQNKSQIVKLVIAWMHATC